LKDLGMNDDVADVLAGIYGGFVGGSIYGPLGAVVGATIGGVIEGVENATEGEGDEPEYTKDEVNQIAFEYAKEQQQQDETFGVGDDGTLANLAASSDDYVVPAQIISGSVDTTSRNQAHNRPIQGFFHHMNQATQQLSHNQSRPSHHHSSAPAPTNPTYQSNRFSPMM
jgi:hypothetical protein